MNHVTGSEIRREVDLITEALERLDEKYMQPGDPSMSVLSFMERVSSHLGALRHVYAQSAGERNTLPDLARPMVVAIREACDDLLATFATPPDEDENRDFGG